FLVCLGVEFGARDAIGPEHSDDIRARLRAQAEVNLRSGDQPLLQQEAGANLDRAADTEGVDALVAIGLRRTRPDDLPVIVFRAPVLRLHGLPVAREAEERELAVPLQISRIENQIRPRARAEKGEPAIFVAEPDKRAVRGLFPHGNRRKVKIDGAVVVEIVGVETDFGCEIPAWIRYPGHLCGVPAVAIVLIRYADQSTISLDDDETQRSVVGHVDDRQSFDNPETCRRRPFAKLALPFVNKMWRWP